MSDTKKAPEVVTPDPPATQPVFTPGPTLEEATERITTALYAIIEQLPSTSDEIRVIRLTDLFKPQFGASLDGESYLTESITPVCAEPHAVECLVHSIVQTLRDYWRAVSDPENRHRIALLVMQAEFFEKVAKQGFFNFVAGPRESFGYELRHFAEEEKRQREAAG